MWSFKCLIRGGALQYVVCNTIPAALRQSTIFQNTQINTYLIIFTGQFLCHKITSHYASKCIPVYTSGMLEERMLSGFSAYEK